MLGSDQDRKDALAWSAMPLGSLGKNSMVASRRGSDLKTKVTWIGFLQ